MLLYAANVLTLKLSTLYPHIIFLGFSLNSEKVVASVLYNIKLLFFVITETISAYCAIRAGSLNIADNIFIFKLLKVTQIVKNVQLNYNVLVFLIYM